MAWLHFECTSTNPHLRVLVVSCNYVTMIYNGVFCRKLVYYFRFPAKKSPHTPVGDNLFNDCGFYLIGMAFTSPPPQTNSHKIRLIPWWTHFMASAAYDRNSWVNYGRKSKTACICALRTELRQQFWKVWPCNNYILKCFPLFFSEESQFRAKVSAGLWSSHPTPFPFSFYLILHF